MSTSRLLSILILACGIVHFGSGQDLNFVPSTPLAFTFPCGNNPRWLVQSFQVQEGNNNWDGIFYMDQFKNIFSVRLQIVLENPASVTLKNTLGNVITSDNRTFVISTFKTPPEIRRIEFRVNGLTQGFFPHLNSLRFNESPLCDNSERDLSAPFMKKSKKCGKVSIGRHQGLIANTYDASPGSWPWHVAIYHVQQGGSPVYKCGGTLINSDVVLTGQWLINSKERGREKMQINLMEISFSRSLHVRSRWRCCERSRLLDSPGKTHTKHGR